MKSTHFKLKLSFTLFAVLAVIISCHKYADPDPIFEDYGNDSTLVAERKVLIIVADGVAGSEISSLNLPSLTALQKKGKYTYRLLQQDTARAASLATIMNGVSEEKHNIVDSTFLPVIENDDDEEKDHSQVPNYPTMFKYLVQYKPKVQSAVVTSYAPFNEYLKVANYRITAINDQGVRDSAVNLLKNKNIGVAVVNFSEALKAGRQGGFMNSNAAYKQALQNLDVNVGKVVDALKSRSNYSREDWLVCVVSPYGGEHGGALPGFMIVSNDKFKEAEVRKVGFTATRFGYNESNARVSAKLSNEGNTYNAGADKDFTAQITVKFEGKSRWPGFFGKSDGVSGAYTTGWTMFQDIDFGGAMMGGSANNTSGKIQLNSALNITGGWKTLTMTVKTEEGVRNARFYVNGELANTTNIGNRNLSTPSPFTIGYIRVDGSGDAEFYAVDALYFNKALDQQAIKSNLNIQDMTKHTEYASIIGFWPLDDGFGSKLVNRAPSGYTKDFVLSGPYKWSSLNNDAPPSRPVTNTGEVSIIASPYDIAANMMYWLKVEIKTSWSLDGSDWLRNFEREIYMQ